MSFIYIINSSGPSIDPCGTPFITLVHPEYTLILFNPLQIVVL
jgi:hypothetical protein